MKKAIALAVTLAAASTGFAQSYVQLAGTVDLKFGIGTGSLGNKTMIGTSGISGSNLRLTANEDLGGGLYAGFWLEAQMDPSTGQGTESNSNNQTTGLGAAVAGRQGLVFNRRSTLSLGGSWGELRLGRDYTPQFWNQNAIDPFVTNGIGANTVLLAGQGGTTTARASNSVGYFLPKLDSGIYGQFATYLGENNKAGLPTDSDGTGSAGRVGWRGLGGLDIALALAKTKYAAGDVRTTNIGSTYNFNPLKLHAMYQQDNISTLAGHGKGYLLGVTYNTALGEFRAAYSTYKKNLVGTPESSKVAVGYVYLLSKRTALYTTVARITNKGTSAVTLNEALTAPGQASSGLDIGIRHNF